MLIVDYYSYSNTDFLPKMAGVNSILAALVALNPVASTFTADATSSTMQILLTLTTTTSFLS